MITPLTLNDALTDFMKKNVAVQSITSCNLVGEVTFKKPQVVTGFIIPKNIGENDNSEFPYIENHIHKVEHQKNSRVSIVTMLSLFGVYSAGSYDKDGKLIEDSSGYRDVWNLIETTRRVLWETQTIDDKYRIVPDFFEAEMISETIYPYHEGFCLTKWEVCFPLHKNTRSD